MFSLKKPLCLNEGDLASIIEAYKKAPNAQLMVGFNRRFSPHVKRIMTLLKNVSVPISLIATMNAGFINEDSWVHDLELGGGRLLGEACHYIDLASLHNKK